VSLQISEAQSARLNFLCEVAQREWDLLAQVKSRLFSSSMPKLTPELLPSFSIEKTEQLDAFVARFGRLQDTLGDKLLPALLLAGGDQPGQMFDNLDRAERFRWIESASDWADSRQLCNRMIHEYIQDPIILCDAVNTAAARLDSLNFAQLAMTAQALKYIAP
jgi:hypothetical protein